MMHIALFGLIVQAVQLLRVAGGAQGDGGQHLGLAAGKEAGAMGAGQDADLGGQGPDLVDAAAVHPLAVIQQPAAHHVFLQLIEAFLDFVDGLGIHIVELLMHLGVHRAQTLVPHALVVGIQGGAYLLDGEVLDGFIHGRIGIVGGEGELLLADLLLYVPDKGDDLLVGGVARHDAVEHGVVVHFVGARLDHGDQVGGGGDGHMHLGALRLLMGGVDNIFAVHQADDDAGNRAVPRDVGNGDGDRGADHGGDFRRAVGIHRHDGADHGHVVAHILGEEGTDGPVDDAGGQDGLLARAALATLEGAGDFAHGIHFFLIVHRQGEEVHAFPRLVRRGDGAQQDGFAIADEAGAAGQLGQLAGFHHEGPAGQGGFKHTIIFEHRVPPIAYISIRHMRGDH